MEDQQGPAGQAIASFCHLGAMGERRVEFHRVRLHKLFFSRVPLKLIVGRLTMGHAKPAECPPRPAEYPPRTGRGTRMTHVGTGRIYLLRNGISAANTSCGFSSATKCPLRITLPRTSVAQRCQMSTAWFSPVERYWSPDSTSTGHAIFFPAARSARSRASSMP